MKSPLLALVYCKALRQLSIYASEAVKQWSNETSDDLLMEGITLMSGKVGVSVMDVLIPFRPVLMAWWLHSWMD